MKKIEHYVCEFCGTEYNDKKKAEECEKGHHKPVKISDCSYSSCRSDGTGTPLRVFIELDNGSVYRYVRETRMK